MKTSIAVIAAVLICALTLAACDGNVHNFSSNPVQYLLTIDQMESPGFTVETTAATLTLGATAAATGQSASTLRDNRLAQSARIAFFRDAGTLALSNGPLQISDTVEVFPDGNRASRQLHSDVGAREADPNEQPISTGPLGSEAHADTALAVAPDVDQTSVIQITLEWRLDNLLNLLVIRGRYGCTRLSDALLLAGRQNQNEEAGGAPLITPAASPHATPAKSPRPIRPSTVASS